MINHPRELDLCETFLHQQAAALAAAHPAPDAHATAETAFVEQLARAVGRYVGELDIETVTRFSSCFIEALCQRRDGGASAPQLSKPVSAQLTLVPVDTPADAGDASLTAEQLQCARMYKKLRQVDLAKRMNVFAWVVSAWERGEFAPLPHEAVKLRQLLGLPATGFPAELLKKPRGQLVRLPKHIRLALDNGTATENA